MAELNASLEPDSAVLLGPSLDDVLAAIPDFDDLSPQVLDNMASSVRTLCRVLDRAPARVPVEPSLLQQQIANASPGAAGVKPANWRNVCSNVRRAVRMADIAKDVRFSDVTPSPEWEALACRADKPTPRGVLRRFGRFCTLHDIGPSGASDMVVARYRTFLGQNQLTKNAERSADDLIFQWNRYVACQEDRLKHLTKPNRSRKYAVDWVDMPQSLQNDVGTYLHSIQHPDPTDPTAPKSVAASTAKRYDSQLRRLIAAELDQGVRPATLKKLVNVVRPGNLTKALAFFEVRLDEEAETSVQLDNLLTLALQIAIHWSKLPPQEVEKIKAVVAYYRHDQHGMTEKNKARLRQFARDSVAEHLFKLPFDILKREQKAQRASRSAMAVQTAVAIAILTVAPIRLGNLRRLDREKNFVVARAGGKPRLHIVIPKKWVKNKIDLEIPVPDPHVALIETYMRDFQPLLGQGRGASLLFPGRGIALAKADSGLREQITKMVRRELGVTMNPHLFRHLCGLLYLEKHPGDYETLRRLLAHKRLQTTINFYAGLETGAAFQRYDEVVLDRLQNGSGTVRENRL